MTISMHAASVPVFQQFLGSLKALLTTAEAQATEKKYEPDALLRARLYPDMFPLIRQVQIACDFAKGASGRLAGVELPVHDDKDQTFADLQALIDKTVAFISALPATAFDGSETRAIVLRPGTPKERSFQGQPYLLHYALPQFFFHINASYALLRHNGVVIGKKDYMGAY